MPRPAIPILDSLWRASEMGTPASHTTPSGHAVLDAELPGGGWPAGQLSEVLQAQAGLHEWRLLLPAVRAAAGAGKVVLIGCPHWPHMAALASQGIPLSAVLLVEADRPADRLWAAEQALRCRDLSALMVWLPQTRAEQLRRLQLAGQAAHQSRPPLAFVFRPLAAQHESSPAPLRLGLRQGLVGTGQPGSLPGLEVSIFKRRGPVLETSLQLHTAVPPVLALRRPAPFSLPAQALPIQAVQAALLATVRTGASDHAVDRTRPTETTASAAALPILA